MHRQARRDGVDAHAVLGGLDRGAAGERHHAGLGRGVVGLALLGAPAEHRGVVHDRALAALVHVGQHGAQAAERAGERHVEHLGPLLVGHVGDQAVAAEAGVVHPDVDVAEVLERGGEQRLHVVLVGDVAAQRDRAGAELLAERVGGLAEPALVGVGDDDAGALEQAATGERAADAGAGGGGDDHGRALEQAAAGRFDRCGLCHVGVLVSVGRWRRSAQRGSRGRPRARSPMTLRWISSEPP